MTRVYLCRHGETDWNRAQRFQGTSDPPLNAYGDKQAEALGRAFSNVPLVAVHSSPLARAESTARQVASVLSLSVATDAAFAEIHHGEWNGKLKTEIRAADGERLAAWEARPETVQFPGGESLAAVSARALPAFAALLDRHAGSEFALVSHDAVLRVLLLDALGLPLSAFGSLVLGNTSVSILDVDESGRRRVSRLNDLCHLGGLAAETVTGAL